MAENERPGTVVGLQQALEQRTQPRERGEGIKMAAGVSCIFDV
jgi:hypothetical protein